jgi:hypothetical protein
MPLNFTLNAFENFYIEFIILSIKDLSVLILFYSL